MIIRISIKISVSILRIVINSRIVIDRKYENILQLTKKMVYLIPTKPFAFKSHMGKISKHIYGRITVQWICFRYCSFSFILLFRLIKRHFKQNAFHSYKTIVMSKNSNFTFLSYLKMIKTKHLLFENLLEHMIVFREVSYAFLKFIIRTNISPIGNQNYDINRCENYIHNNRKKCLQATLKNTFSATKRFVFANKRYCISSIHVIPEGGSESNLKPNTEFCIYFLLE